MRFYGCIPFAVADVPHPSNGRPAVDLRVARRPARRFDKKEKRHMNASHITALKSKHATLDQAIAEEMRKPAPDDAAIQSLKKQKLRLKEEMGGV